MKTSMHLLAILILFQNCKTRKEFMSAPINKYTCNELSGIYKQGEAPFYSLTLHEDSSFLFSKPSSRQSKDHRDTITYGTWNIESNSMLTLSSPASLSEKLQMKVEEAGNSNQDTVYIEINNPIEEWSIRNQKRTRIVKYEAMVFTTKMDLLKKVDDTERTSIKLYNPNGADIFSFNILIYPGPDIYLPEDEIRDAQTESYFPFKNKKSNQFHVEIPGLTNNFLRSRRLNRDFVKVVDKNELEWDGHLFVKVKE